MKYRITAAARRDLDAVWLYTNSNGGLAKADRYVDLLITRFAWLTKNRELWRPRDDLGKGLYTQSEGSYLIVFSTDRRILNILRILHSRMDVLRHVE